LPKKDESAIVNDDCEYYNLIERFVRPSVTESILPHNDAELFIIEAFAKKTIDDASFVGGANDYRVDLEEEGRFEDDKPSSANDDTPITQMFKYIEEYKTEQNQ